MTDRPPDPRPLCIDHMTLPVGDLDASLRFYRAALVDGMGWVEREVEGLSAFGPEDGEDLILAPGGPLTPPIHLAFAAVSRAQLEGFHSHGLAAGGRDNGAPGPRLQYSPGYFGAFLFDPDGHNVEAVYHQPRADRAQNG